MKKTQIKLKPEIKKETTKNADGEEIANYNEAGYFNDLQPERRSRRDKNKMLNDFERDILGSNLDILHDDDLTFEAIATDKLIKMNDYEQIKKVR